MATATSHADNVRKNDTSKIGRWVLLATITASSMAFIDGSALNVALTALQNDLHASGADLIWVVNGYLLTLAALILLGGSLGDRFGRNRIFRIGIIIFVSASFACGISPSISILLVARLVQGVGGALMVPGSLAIISASFSGDERGRAIGTWSSFGTVTTILAPVLGGFLANVGLWRGVFFINLPLAVVAIWALRKVPETRDDQAPRQLDYPGTALITLGLAGLTYGAIGLGQANSGALPWVALIVGVVALISFVMVEGRSTHPLVPLALFRERTFSGTNLMTVFLYGALSGSIFFLSLNLIQVQGYPSNIAGLALLPLSLILAGLSPVMGRLVARIGPRLPLTVGSFLAGVGFVVMALPAQTNGPTDYWVSYFPGIVLLGIGMGIVVAPLTTAVMGSVPTNRSGVASGVNNAVARAAQGLALAALGGLALVVFSNGLTGRIAPLNLQPDVSQQLHDNANKLANMELPKTLDDADHAAVKTSVQQAIHASFIDTFRLVLLICAVAAWIASAASAILVGNKLSTPDAKPADAEATA